MKKFILMTTLLVFLFAACQNTGLDSLDYEQNIPQWLKDKIEIIEADPAMVGSIVYRYNWTDDLVFHINIPVSSCAYCELYTRDGERINYLEIDLPDFIQNRTDEVIIWKWE